MRTKVYKATVMIIDHDHIGEKEIASVLENTRYPNRCINPTVMPFMQIREVDWSDDHPLNFTDRQHEEFAKLFGEGTSLWVSSISQFIGKEITLERKGSRDLASLIPRRYTLLGVDEECLFLEGTWPIDHTGRPGPGAKKYRFTIDRKEVASVGEAIE